VKSDAIFAYRPPFNVLALLILLPLKLAVNDRWFHKINVTAVRVLNAPILLLISLYERRYLWKRSRFYSPPRKHTWLTMWERFGAHGDLQAVFDTDPPQSVLEEMDDVDDVLGGEMWEGPGGYVDALRRRRGSRSVYSVDGNGMFSRSMSRAGGGNGLRRRSTRSLDQGRGEEFQLPSADSGDV